MSLLYKAFLARSAKEHGNEVTYPAKARLPAKTHLPRGLSIFPALSPVVRPPRVLRSRLTTLSVHSGMA